MKITSLALAATLLGAAAAQATTVYDSTGIAGGVSEATEHYMEFVTLAPAPNAGGVYDLDAVSNIGVTITNNLVGNQAIYVNIFSGVDPATGSYNAPTATEIGTGVATISTTGLNVGTTYFYTIALSTPTPVTGAPSGIPLLTTDQNLEVEVELTDGAGVGNATGIEGRFTQSATPASVGSNSLATAGGYIYSNSDVNTDFTAANQTTFGTGTPTAIRFQLDATPVPEPSALVFSAIAGCAMLGSFFRFRKAKFVA